MVHALQEAWRVLIPRGMLIDLRPVGVSGSLEIVTSTGYDFAGLVDLSLNAADDIAADNAVQNILHSGIFMELRVEYFDFNYYWNTLMEMKADMDDRWKGDIIVPDSVYQQASLLFDQRPGQGRVRLRLRKKMGTHLKQ